MSIIWTKLIISQFRLGFGEPLEIDKQDKKLPSEKESRQKNNAWCNFPIEIGTIEA